MVYKCPHCPFAGDFGSPIIAHIVLDHPGLPEMGIQELLAESARLRNMGLAQRPGSTGQVQARSLVPTKA